MSPARRLLPFLAAFLLGLPAAARAQTWLPLDTGNFWSCAGPTAAEVQTVEGTAEVRGVPTQVILFSPSTSNEGVRQFWTNGPDGDVLLHAADRAEITSVAYDPPVQFVDAPLWLGKIWQQTVDVYTLEGGFYLDTWELAFLVYEEREITTPAGTFSTFGIGFTVPASLERGSFGLDGTRITAGRGDLPLRYYAENVGQARYTTDETYDLLAYGSPTPVESWSWAGVKSLYR